MEFSRKHTVLIVAAILLIGIALRAYRLGYQSFWIDEVLTALRSGKDLTQVLARYDLYYLIVHAFTKLGNQEYILRLPSMIFGSLSIALFYFVLRNWFGKTMGFIGSMMMAISPFHIWYSQDARAYALLVFLSLLSIWSLQQLVRGRTNFLWKLSFILSTSATLYCHKVAIGFIGFLGVYVLIFVPRQKWVDWLPLFGGVALLIVPRIYPLFVFSTSSGASTTQSQPFNLLVIPYGIWAFVTGFSLGPTTSDLHFPSRMGTVLGYFGIILPVMLFFSAMVLLGALRLWNNKSKSLFWATALWFLFPLALGVVGAIKTGFPLNPRYWILSFPPFLLFVSMGVQTLRATWLRIATFAIIGFISVFSLGNYYFNERYQRDNNRAAGQILTLNSQADDLIIVTAPYTLRSLKYYYSGNNDLVFTPYPSGHGLVKPARLESDLKAIIKDRGRFWLFLSRTFHSDPEGYIREYCDKRFDRRLEFKSTGVKLILYQ